jgi:hypothetical protein
MRRVSPLEADVFWNFLTPSWRTCSVRYREGGAVEQAETGEERNLQNQRL